MADATSGCDEHCDELDFSARLRFADTLGAEYEEVHLRRTRAGTPDQKDGRPRRLRALSLSGGGIRSATFNLGLLQALHAAGKLRTFDYLSTVSGGGYVGGWWSAWLSRSQPRADVFPPPERFESDRDIERSDLEERSAREHRERRQVNDASLTAGVDPIHHLRLFSNFLTPHKGLLSGDTWRAIAVIGRNLILTWMILVPIILAVIMLGQSWFALNPETTHGFLWRPDLGVYVTSHHASGTAAPDEAPVSQNQRDDGDLTRRLVWALLLPALLYVGSVVCVALWMVANRRCWAVRDLVVVTLSGVAWAILTWLLSLILGVPIRTEFPYALAAWIVIIAIILGVWQHRHDAVLSDVDFWKNRLVNLQTTTLKYSAVTAVVLLFAAFGHEFVDFLLFNQQLKSSVATAIARAGGLGAVALAALSAIYTAVKASPTGGEDVKAKNAPPSLLQRLAFALAPPLLVAVLGLGLAWIGHRLYTTVYQDQHEELWLAIIGSLISALLFLVFALYEFRPPQKWKSLIVVVLWLLVAVGEYLLPVDLIQTHLVTIGAVSGIVVAVALAVRAFVTRSVPIVLGAALVAGVALFLFVHFPHADQVFRLQRSHVPQLVVAGIFFTLVLLVFELVAGRGANTRSLWLMILAFLIFVLLGAAACAGPVAWQSLAMVGLISSILGWVLALGWLADPNALTVHGFYKARLVRAYMGASNDRRSGVTEADITDAVPGDDVLLTDLANTAQGAPYHLINTTLNLVGGSDLATQQRFSDSFVLSKHYCGSLRTGYRPTSQYACGTLSLGTAVSVSGAAASPEMGQGTPSAALVALLTLFNVRLGYWAPTPNRAYWRSGSPRLWPIYTLEELLAQTTDLLPFCYLTDGGHFDNSGVYSLVQRGCNFIVYSDCGADPETTFDDIGNLIRKVRIDFGTEIVLDDIDDFRSDPPKQHFVKGRIVYAKAHADSIGLAEDEREGIIVIVKPNRTPGATADVLQYGYTNATYPQQSTANQWYDEAQFESYRKLGEISGQALVAGGVV